jgi:hypothetical protein
VQGNQSLTSESIIDRIHNSVSHPVMYVLPGDNIFIISKNKLIENLKKDFPLIKNISIKKTSFSSIGITLDEYVPTMLFCQSENLDTCFLVSSDGILFEHAPKFSNSLYFMLYDNYRTDQVVLGQPAFDGDTLKKIITLKKELEIFGMNPKAFKRADQDTFIISKNNTSETFNIVFKSNQSVETIMSNLTSALKSTTLKDSKNNGYQNLEYIDVRFTNKVFYKVR